MFMSWNLLEGMQHLINMEFLLQSMETDINLDDL